jgi:hypothetical protein
MGSNEKDELLLTQLILMFQTAALQQMGKLKNPMVDKIQKDLEQAQISIDMIDMLQRKMKGNLSAEEDRLISNIIRELKLNYVDEVAKSQQRGSSQGVPPPPQPKPDV